VGFLKDIIHILILSIRLWRIIYPIMQYSKTQFSNIPAFHYSNHTTLRLSTGKGEATNLPLSHISTDLFLWSQFHDLGIGRQIIFAVRVPPVDHDAFAVLQGGKSHVSAHGGLVVDFTVADRSNNRIKG
jgi:hypothetical protein